MTVEDIPVLRSYNQKISDPMDGSVRDLTDYLCAIQAQDYPMSRWALGMRMEKSTERMIMDAIDSGDIIRTHLLRPTWHIASADNVFWLLKLSASGIKGTMKFNDKRLGLTEDIFSQCNKIIEKAFKNDHDLTREELVSVLKKAGIRLDENRPAHILMRAEIEGIICSGKHIRGKPSYSLLDRIVPENKRIFQREEALNRLGLLYFKSRGPATASDFKWWSGLSSADVKLTLNLCETELSSETIEGKTYFFIENSHPGNDKTAYLVPAYDELLISYSDRSASLSYVNRHQTIYINGFFNPAVIMKGQVIGTWKRVVKDKSVSVNIFENDHIDLKTDLSATLKKYSLFVGRDTRLMINS